jgi:cell division protein FtsW (lipid II flippase)
MNLLQSRAMRAVLPNLLTIVLLAGVFIPWALHFHLILFIVRQLLLCSELFSFHLPRFTFIPSVTWPWLCECQCFLLGFVMVGCVQKRSKTWARISQQQQERLKNAQLTVVGNEVMYKKNHFQQWKEMLLKSKRILAFCMVMVHSMPFFGQFKKSCIRPKLDQVLNVGHF